MWPGLIPSLLGMFQGQQAAGNATTGQAGGAAMGAKTVKPPQKVSLQNDSPDTAIQELAQTQAKVNPEAKVQPEEFSNADGTTSMEIRNPDGSYSQAPQEVSPVDPTVAQAQAGKQSIWDKLSGGIKKFDEGYTQRLQDRGYMEKPGSAPPGLGADKPWSVQDIADDQWVDRKGGILFNPEDPELRNKMIGVSSGDDGNLMADRYKMVQDYMNQTKDNPVYQEKRDEHYKGFGGGIFPGIDRAIGKFFGVQDDKIDLRGN